MAWEWLAPTATVIAAGITAGLGGFYGGRKTQERQHKFERKISVDARGREKAEEAIAALRFLKRHHAQVVSWDNPAPAGDLDEPREQYDRLGRAVEYLTDEAVRREVEMLHSFIGILYSKVDVWIHEGKTVTPGLVWFACTEGISILGQYLRDEPMDASRENLVLLRRVYEKRDHD